MKQSLKNQLYSYLKSRQGFIHSVELEDYGRSIGYTASNVTRRLRELRDAGSIESELRLYEGTRIAWWRAKEVRPTQPSLIQTALFTHSML